MRIEWDERKGTNLSYDAITPNELIFGGNTTWETMIQNLYPVTDRFGSIWNKNILQYVINCLPASESYHINLVLPSHIQLLV